VIELEAFRGMGGRQREERIVATEFRETGTVLRQGCSQFRECPVRRRPPDQCRQQLVRLDGQLIFGTRALFPRPGPGFWGRWWLMAVGS